MSRADDNLESYANQRDIVLAGGPLLDGQDYDDALKFSNCRGVVVRDRTILGGREDCIDINRGEYLYLHDLNLHPKGKYAVTIKGGAKVVALTDILISGKGSEVDIDLGNWSDQSGDRVSGVSLTRVTRHDGTPVIVRVLHADMPLVIGGNVKVLDRRWMAWFYRLGKRWGILS